MISCIEIDLFLYRKKPQYPGPPSVTIWHSGWLSSSLVRIPPRSEKRMRRLKASGLLEPLVLCPPITRAGWWANVGGRAAVCGSEPPLEALWTGSLAASVFSLAARTAVVSVQSTRPWSPLQPLTLLPKPRSHCSGCRPRECSCERCMLDDDSRFESAGRSFGRRRRVRNSPWWNWEASGGCTSTTIRIVLRGIVLSFE